MANNDVYVVSHLARGVSFLMPDGSKVRLNSRNDHLKGKESGILTSEGGCITKIAKDKWEYIKSHWKNFEPIKNGLIYASEKYNDAKAQAQEKQELKSGLEPVNIKNTKTKPVNRK